MTFRRIAIVNRGEAAMRLIHAVRDLNAQTGGRTHRDRRAAHRGRAAGDVRARGRPRLQPRPRLGPALPRPRRPRAGAASRPAPTPPGSAGGSSPRTRRSPSSASASASPSSARAPRRCASSATRSARSSSPRRSASRSPRGAAARSTPSRTRSPRPTRSATRSCSRRPPAAAGAASAWSRSDADLTDAYERTRDEAQRAFGCGVVFLESLVTGARHVEVQVIADGQGTAWALGVRDCSVQRRNQKVIEESASPVLVRGADARAQGQRRAARRRRRVRRRRHRRVPLPPGREVLRLPRGQHPAAGRAPHHRGHHRHRPGQAADPRRRPAAGSRASGRPRRGHAVEARLNAEDPDRDFAPAPGPDRPARPARGSRHPRRHRCGRGRLDPRRLRLDDRQDHRLRPRPRRGARPPAPRHAPRPRSSSRAARPTRASSSTCSTSPRSSTARADTGWIDRVRGEGRLVAHRHSGVALVAAGIEAYEDEEAGRAHPPARDRPRRPPAGAAQGRAGPSTSSCAARHTRSLVLRTGPHRFRCPCRRRPRAAVDADLDRIDEYAEPAHRRGPRTASSPPPTARSTSSRSTASTHRVSRDEGGVLRSPAPALVVATPVAVGDEVAAGAPVLVLETMKMETVLPAPFAAHGQGAARLHRQPGRDRRPAAAARATRPRTTTRPPHGGDEPAEDLELPVRRAPSATDGRGGRARADRPVGRCCSATTSTRATRAAPSPHTSRRATSPSPPRARSPIASEVVAARAVRRLRRAEPQPAGRRGASTSRTACTAPGALPHLPAEPRPRARARCPTSSAQRLLRVLRHYGVDRASTARRELEEAVFRVFLAQQRSAPDVQLATSLLQRWITEPLPRSRRRPRPPATCSTGWCSPPSCASPSSATSPAACGSAGSTSRSSTPSGPPCWRRCASEVALLADQPDAEDRAARIDALAAIPEQIVRFLAGAARERRCPSASRCSRCSSSGTTASTSCTHLTSTTVDGRPVRRRRLPPRRPADAPRLDDRQGQRAEARQRAGRRGHRRGRRRGPGSRERRRPLPVLARGARQRRGGVRRRSGALVEQLDVIRRVRRIAIAVGAGADRPPAYFTFRPTDDGGVVEDDLVRGVHPMVGRRLNLWRLRKFTRHPARGARGRAALLRGRQGEPRRPAPRRAGAGPAARRRPRRVRPGHVAAARGARDRQLPRGDPPRPGRPWRQGRPPRHEPRLAPGLAGHRGRGRPAHRPPEQHRPAHGGRRDRGDPRGRPAWPGRTGRSRRSRRGSSTRPGPGSPPTWGCRRPRCSSRSTTTQQKVLRARRRGTVYPYEMQGLVAGVGRIVGRVRPRRQRTARPGRPTAGTQQGRHHRRRRHDANPACTRREFAGCVLSGDPHPGTGRGVGGGVRPDHRRARPRRGAATSRSSGTPCRPARGSRWTRAPRTWTGWPGR